MNKYSDNAMAIYKKLYFERDEKDNLIEKHPIETHERVAKAIADNENQKKAFLDILNKGLFRPNSPVLINAGGPKQCLSACYVLGLEDSMDSIIDCWGTCAKIYASGAGAGVPLTNLRKKDGPITFGGRASGPLSYTKVLDVYSETVKAGNKARRAANMGMLKYDHPDIFDLINCKLDRVTLKNFNLSVSMTNSFMRNIKSNNLEATYYFIDPKTGTSKETFKGIDLWNKIIKNAWTMGDPGLFFVDLTNMWNPFRSVLPIECTNPSLRKGTKILTDKGIFPIDELEGKQIKVPTINGKYSPANCILSGKNKQLWKLTLKGGHEYYCTKEHKWPIYENGKYIKKETKNLQKGMWIPLGNQYENIIFNGPLGTYDDGFLIGWNLGDGSIILRKDNSNFQFGFYFGAEKIELMDKIISILEKITNIKFNPTEIYRQGEIWYEIHSSNQKLFELFNKFNVDHKSSGLPSCIWNECSEEFKKGLIDGIFSTDGSIDIEQKRIILTSSEKQFIYDISDLLGFYGIKHNIQPQILKNVKFPNKKKYKRTYEIYRLIIGHSASLKFRELFTISNNNKQQNLNNFPSILKTRNKLQETHYQIESIVPTDIYEDVWDLQVYENSHTFNLSKLVTGNCGEVPLWPWSECVIGSINVSQMYDHSNHLDHFDWNLFKGTIRTATKFLDNCIDKTTHPHPKFKETMDKYRPIGLGIMGLADLFVKMKVPYDSPEARLFFSKLCKTMTLTSIEESIAMCIGGKKGIKFPNKDCKDEMYKLISHYTSEKEILNDFKKHGIRNCTWTSIAPTGSIALSADCSYSFEPLSAIVWEKELAESHKIMKFINPEFESWIVGHYGNNGLKIDPIINDIIDNNGSVQGINGIPEKIQRFFRTAHDIDPYHKIDMQAAGQEYISLAISSTCNLPKDITEKEIGEIFLYAWEKGLKGITVYRDGSHEWQPINFGKKDDNEKSKLEEWIKDKRIIHTIHSINNKLERPIRRRGETFEINTPHGRLYCTFNKDNEGRPLEVFLRLGKSGTLENLLLDTISRLVSKNLQNCVPYKDVSSILRGIKGDLFRFKFMEDASESVAAESIIDAVGIIMEVAFEELKEIKPEDVKITFHNLNAEECPECHQFTLVRTTGCRGGMCENPECLYTSCG